MASSESPPLPSLSSTASAAPPLPAQRKHSISVSASAASLKRLHKPSGHPDEVHTYTLCLLGRLQNFAYSTTGSIKEIPLQLDDAIQQVGCGLDWLCLLTEQGQLYSFGNNTYGQLAQGHMQAVPYPKPVVFPVEKRITKVSCGSCHGGFLLECGALFMFGCGTYGRLGTGNEGSQSTPVAVKMRWKDLETKAAVLSQAVRSTIPGISVTSTTGSRSSSMAGSIATQHQAQDFAPTLDDEPDDVVFVDISCGDRHTLLLGAKPTRQHGKRAAKNHIIAFGDGLNGRLGLGSERDQHTGALLTQFRTSVSSYTPSFLQISAGNAHNAAISSSGEVFTWGNGADGQLGHGANESEWLPRDVQFLRGVSMAMAKCGAKHTVAVSRTGVVYTWGRGTEGQLGSGNAHSTMQPHRVTLVVDPLALQQAQIDAQLAVGASSSSSLLTVQDTRVLVRSVVAKDNVTLALDEQSRLFAWGDNGAGQLGLHPIIDSPQDSSRPSSHSAITRVATPRQLLYMDLHEPRRQTAVTTQRERMIASAASLPRAALSHIDASDRFSLLVFKTKPLSAAAMAGHGTDDALSHDQVHRQTPDEVRSATQRLIRQQSSLFTGLPPTNAIDKWHFTAHEPLPANEIPSREADYYNYMAQYKVCVRPPTPTPEDAENKDTKEAGKHRRASTAMGRWRTPNQEVEEELAQDEQEWRRRQHTSAAEAVKGFSAWLERRSLETQLSPRSPHHRKQMYAFGNAPRFHDEASPPSPVKQEEVAPPSTTKPKCDTSRPRPPRSAFGRTLQQSPRASVCPRSSRPQRPASASCAIGSSKSKAPTATQSPPPLHENRQRLLKQFVAPFGSSTRSRFGPSSPRANDGNQLELHVEACDKFVFPRSPCVSSVASNADHYSLVISRRLREAKGPGPGPGTYDRHGG